MDFTAMDARAYRSLNSDQYETRRSLVLSLAENLPEDATEEQIRSIDDELGFIKAEDARRDSLAETRNHKAVAVLNGSGKVISSTNSAGAEERAADSVGSHFASYVKERGHDKSFHIVAPAYRAYSDVLTTPSSIIPAITTYDKNIVTAPRIPMNVLDLLNREVIDGNTLVYFVEGALEGAPAVTAEGATKPQVHFADPTAKTVTLQKIAAYIKESDEVIDDAQFLTSVINGRLVYELNYVRQATVISELLGTTGIQTATWPSVATFTDLSLDIADAVAAAIADVQEQSGYAADGIVITPTLWKKLRTGHFDSGEYIGGGYFEQGAAPTLWGLPVAVSSQLTDGHILVGAFGTCASLVSKAEGVTVEATNTDQDDFIKNLMTIRAEVRERLAVRRPAGFVDLTVGSGGDVSA